METDCPIELLINQRIKNKLSYIAEVLGRIDAQDLIDYWTQTRTPIPKILTEQTCCMWYYTIYNDIKHNRRKT